MSFLEYATAGEDQFDFCLWPYPAVQPCDGKLRSVSLLADSFEGQQMGRRAMDMVSAIRAQLGDLRTVWGVKQAGGEISWEFYFYDYARTERERSIPRLLEILRPWVSCDIHTSETAPYFMFSVDFSRELLTVGGKLEELQMYIGNIGSMVSSGICYGVTQHGKRLKNFYFFFDARKEMSEIEGKVCASAYLDDADFKINEVLWPELRDCEVIVVANKQDRDGVYFSRISVSQLLWFLKMMRYPDRQIQFLESNMDRLDHMLYDVGFDYRMEGGRLTILKSAYYGVF
ncbi:MAG: hypothetical protein Q8M11_17650 [Sulfuritalea sp.]|nr:hypothetical protein [Sulfuritalea sp.]MDP1985406.1 hypothetical protein [Sulfuritalea sp.]